ncbi:MAG: hypothetical protein JKY56_21295, partial [Kofleriaceae bacterium]|nr:hypothetical protein [Kofleriaceae bacterium]
DRDSDNDGLADAAEDTNCNGILDPGETSATSDDTDNDGVSDLVEDVAGTDPNDPLDNPASHGDFFFLMPYEAPADPSQDTLEFRTSVQFADIYFSIDTTGSMGQEIGALGAASGIPTIISELTCNVIGGTCMLDSECATGVCFGGTCIQDPGVGDGCVPDLYSGVGAFDELNTFRNLQSLQPDPAVTASRLPSLGGGSREAPFHSAHCVADGVACPSPIKNCSALGVGCPGFRSNAVRILIQVTDADDQCSGAGCPSVATAGAAMQAAGINFIGLYGSGDEGGAGTALSVARDIGLAAGSVDAGGNPFIYSANDGAVVAQTKAAVLDIVQNLPLNTTITQSEVDMGDDGDALPFIDYVEVNVSGTGNCTAVMDIADTDADTRPDAFPTLRPGTPVCWDVHPVASNTTVQATDSPLVFIATLTVNGDGSPLDSRRVFFLVPPVLDQIDVD